MQVTDVAEVLGVLVVGTAGNDVISPTRTVPGQPKPGDGDDVLFGLAGNDKLTAGAGADMLYGGAGKDTLDGGTGSDAMAGGGDNDTYVVDDLGDTVDETDGFGGDAGGTDTVKSSVDFALGTFVEKLTLTGTDDLAGTGNDLANKIIGTSGANVLAGFGGKDSLTGGDGDDTLYGGTEDDKLYGGIGSDHLYGGAGKDILDGGTGSDAMAGGGDNDTYVVDDLGDTVDETDGFGGDAGGTDTVKSSVDFALGAFVEKLTLTGTGDLAGTGNDLANKIIGTSGANVLAGFGGNDSLIGGDGDDKLYGGAGNDTLSGGNGDDILVGGAGKDTLTGGSGVDEFVFNTAPLATEIDTIKDFSGDVLVFDSTVFTGLLADADQHLLSSQFHLGPSAGTTNDRIIYDPTNGKLYFDADGLGGALQVQFATLTGHPTLSATDLLIL